MPTTIAQRATMWRNFAAREGILILVTDNDHLLHYVNPSGQHCTKHYTYIGGNIQFLDEPAIIIEG